MSNGVVLETCGSTQDELLARLRGGEDVPWILAREQTAARGRRGRPWASPRDASLSVSAAFPDWTEHPAPWLLGMLVALVAAELTDAGLRWPNDLVIGDRKLGGLLHERATVNGRPMSIVGLGMNLRRAALPPEVADIAISLEESERPVPDPLLFWQGLYGALRSEPRPVHWNDLAPRWARRDATPGKRYLLPDGRETFALRVGPGGELITTLGPIDAATAIFDGRA